MSKLNDTICVGCKKNFASREELLDHRIYCLGDEHNDPGEPTYRTIKIETESEKPPVVVNANDTRLPCPECGKYFRGKLGLGIHRSKIHGVMGQIQTAKMEKEEERKKKAEGAGMLVCETCGMGFKTKGGLGGHIFAKHGAHTKRNVPVPETEISFVDALVDEEMIKSPESLESVKDYLEKQLNLIWKEQDRLRVREDIVCDILAKLEKVR